jgi:hypothetical protein
VLGVEDLAVLIFQASQDKRQHQVQQAQVEVAVAGQDYPQALEIPRQAAMVDRAWLY